MMSESEAFAQEWELTERSRHARLMGDLKREFRAEPGTSVPVEPAIAAPYSVRLVQSVPRQQVKPQGRPKEMQPSQSQEEPS